MNPYETLGVEKDASPEDIKAAYRREVSKAHPDREGGSAEAAQKVNDAYAVLSDPERRARYDQTGSDGPTQTPQQKAQELVIQAFMQALDKDSRDPLGYARSKMDEIKSVAVQRERVANRRIEGLTKMSARANSKSGSRLLHDMLEAQIGRQRATLAEAKEATAMADDALTLMADFVLDPEPNSQPTQDKDLLEMISLMGNFKRPKYGKEWV